MKTVAREIVQAVEDDRTTERRCAARMKHPDLIIGLHCESNVPAVRAHHHHQVIRLWQGACHVTPPHRLDDTLEGSGLDFSAADRHIWHLKVQAS
jgi:hypothetical protein